MLKARKVETSNSSDRVVSESGGSPIVGDTVGSSVTTLQISRNFDQS